MENRSLSTCLEIQSRFSVHLGAKEEERRQLQTVWMRFHIFLNHAPRACETDALEDTIDYAELVEQVQEFCLSQKFHLIEYLGYKIYHFLKQSVLPQSQLRLEVIKHPPSVAIEQARVVLDDRSIE